MSEIVELLEDKNHCLERFYRLNETELLNFVEGKFEGLERFYTARESLLEMVQKIDFQIEKSNDLAFVEDPITDLEKKQVIESITYKNDLVNQILAQDLQILSVIEQTKSNIIKELATLGSAKKAIKSYKSGSEERKVDEKV